MVLPTGRPRLALELRADDLAGIFPNGKYQTGIMQEEKLTFGNFAEHLASLLNARGVTAKAVAEVCGVSQAALSRYIAGQRMPRYAEALKLADYFGIHPDYLLNPARYSQGIKSAAREADEMKGTPDQKAAYFNKRVKEQTGELSARQEAWDDAMRLQDGEDWQTRALTAERKIAKLKKILQEAMVDL